MSALHPAIALTSDGMNATCCSVLRSRFDIQASQRSAVAPPAGSKKFGGSHANILVPKPRMLLDELPHEPDAVRVLKHLDSNAPGAQQFFFSLERFVFADHHSRDSVQENRAR